MERENNVVENFDAEAYASDLEEKINSAANLLVIYARLNPELFGVFEQIFKVLAPGRSLKRDVEINESYFSVGSQDGTWETYARIDGQVTLLERSTK